MLMLGMSYRPLSRGIEVFELGRGCEFVCECCKASARKVGEGCTTVGNVQPQHRCVETKSDAFQLSSI
jgi:hypothetical protein